jgi:hypothetical protein
MEAVVVVLLIAFPAVGAVTRSRRALALPIVGWPLLYLGLDRGWWGNGLGDAWEMPATALLLFGTVTTALAVALARLRHRRDPHPAG